MRNKKSLVLIALATFCLTLSLFMVKPTRSQTSSDKYDPFLDTNSDGTIDIYDAIQFAGVYGSSGDPTKNVNVTNWPITIQTVPATISGRIVWINPLPGVSDGYHLMSAIVTGGYQKIYISLTGYCNLTIGWRLQGAFNASQSWWSQIDHYEEFETGIFQSPTWREFDIKGETLAIWLGDTYSSSYELSYYMTS